MLDETMRQIFTISEILATTSGGWSGSFWRLELPWLIVSLAVLAMLVAVAWYVVGKIRPKSENKEQTDGEWLLKYRDSHSRGELTDAEYRTIKTTLNERHQDELKDSSKSDYTANG
jgi:uncharacterized membrane protein